jgi:hypothetical protein
LYYEINLTNIHNYVIWVDVNIGKITENGPTVTRLYRRTVSLPSEICCRSAIYESKHTKFFFNGTICTLVKNKYIELVILCMAQYYLVIILWSDSWGYTTVFHFVNGFLMIHLILLASLPCLYILLVVFRHSLYDNIPDVSC